MRPSPELFAWVGLVGCVVLATALCAIPVYQPRILNPIIIGVLAVVLVWAVVSLLSGLWRTLYEMACEWQDARATRRDGRPR